MKARLAAGAVLSLSLSAGCVSTTPLAPGFRGSVGAPNSGILTEPTELPVKGVGFRRYRPWAATYHGTKPLVRTLEFAGSRFSGGPPLVVGDIAGKRGGKLPGHSSHRTGRDVDLLFFYMTAAGQPIESPGFVKVGADGLALVALASGSEFIRLDVPRTWELVKALLESPHAEVAWLFVSTWVEAQLIQYARARDESPFLLWRAENVMHQPKDAAPHDDHFHLRIHCSAEEGVSGCLSGGPEWPWFAPPPSLSPTLDTAALVLEDSEPLGPFEGFRRR